MAVCTCPPELPRYPFLPPFPLGDRKFVLSSVSLVSATVNVFDVFLQCSLGWRSFGHLITSSTKYGGRWERHGVQPGQRPPGPPRLSIVHRDIKPENLLVAVYLSVPTLASPL